MPKRNSPSDIKEIDDLNRLSEIVNDKRNDKRASKKKSRRDRHYEKQFIKNSIKNLAINKQGEDFIEMLDMDTQNQHS